MPKSIMAIVKVPETVEVNQCKINERGFFKSCFSLPFIFFSLLNRRPLIAYRHKCFKKAPTRKSQQGWKTLKANFSDIKSNLMNNLERAPAGTKPVLFYSCALVSQLPTYQHGSVYISNAPANSPGSMVYL